MGTPGYMAPEQAAGRTDVGPAADIYALGAILYECLTGRPPFRAASTAETFGQVLNDDPVPPGRLQPNLPRDLDTICLKCLRKEPDKRYASAADVADDLRRFLHGEPIRARTVPPWERAAKWARRRPAAAGLVAVSVLAAVGLGILGYRYLASLERHNRELTDLNERLAQERDATVAQRQRAEANLVHAAEAIDEMLVHMGMSRVAGIPHIDRTRAKLLEDAVRVSDRLLAVQPTDPRARLMRAQTCIQSGNLHRQLGRFREADGRFGEALELLRALREEAPAEVPVATLRILQARAHAGRGTLYLQTGNPARARTEHEAAMAVRDELLSANPDDPTARLESALGNTNLALAAEAAGDRQRLELYLARALPLIEALAAADRPPPEVLSTHAFVLNAFGAFYLQATRRTGRSSTWTRRRTGGDRCSSTTRRTSTTRPTSPRHWATCRPPGG
jgi:tetratricopeptide (TPR) repeat protein